MKRALIAALAAVLPLTAGAAPASATDLPTVVTVEDPHGDMKTNWSPRQASRPLDIYWVRGARVGTNLVLTIKVKDLTETNTRQIEDGAWRWMASGLSVAFRADGRDYTTFYSVFGTASVDGPDGSICEDSNPFDSIVEGAQSRPNLDTERMRLIIPLDCLGNPKVARIMVARTQAEGSKEWRDDTRSSRRFSLR